ncbi:MAG: TetR/AcrR family transcriptional regulator [Microbacter sp.]
MDEIKDQILQAASRMFLQYGLRSVTIDEVCNEVHISKKTFYNYFRQKEELIEMVLMNQCEVQKQKQHKKYSVFDDPSLNAIDKLVLAFKHWKQDSSAPSMTFVYDLVKYYPEIHAKMLERQEQDGKEATKKWIQQGIDEGLIRTDVDADLLAIYIQFQFSKVLSELIGKSDIGVNAIIEFLLDSNIRVLVNEKGYRYYQLKYKQKYPTLSSVPSDKEEENTPHSNFYWASPSESEKES